MSDNRNPTPEEVRLIFRDVYNFYTKWSSIDNDENWSNLLNDIHEINLRYPFEYCRKKLLDTIDLIESDYMERKNPNG